MLNLFPTVLYLTCRASVVRHTRPKKSKFIQTNVFNSHDFFSKFCGIFRLKILQICPSPSFFSEVMFLKESEPNIWYLPYPRCRERSCPPAWRQHRPRWSHCFSALWGIPGQRRIEHFISSKNVHYYFVTHQLLEVHFLLVDREASIAVFSPLANGIKEDIMFAYIGLGEVWKNVTTVNIWVFKD